MKENKPTSLAITVVILLAMFHVTIVLGLFTIGLMSVGWKNPMDVFYYWIDYTLPITFLVSFINCSRIEDGIFLKKTTKWENNNDEGLIISAPTFSLIMSFIVILIINVVKMISWDTGIFIIHIFLFGGIATYIVTLYAVFPFIMLLNIGISFLTNWIFNTIFAKHLKFQGII